MSTITKSSACHQRHLTALPKRYQSIMRLMKNGFIQDALIFQPEKCHLPVDCLQLKLNNQVTPHSKPVINTCSFTSGKECPSSCYTRCKAMEHSNPKTRNTLTWCKTLLCSYFSFLLFTHSLVKLWARLK